MSTHAIDTGNYLPRRRMLPHQFTVVDNSWMLPHQGLHLEMGLGKTQCIIDSLALQHANDLLTHCLILAPKTVCSNWIAEFEEVWPNTYTHVDILRWDGLNTKTSMANWKRLLRDDDGVLRVLVMNTEALSSKKGRDRAYEFLRTVAGPAGMVIDESTTIKNRAARTKAAVALSRYTSWRRTLSGLPMPNSPLDIFAPTAFLEGSGQMACPKLLAQTNFYSFKSRYCTEETIFMGSRSFKKVTGFKSLGHLRDKLDQFCIRLTKDECLNLPSKTYVRRNVELTPEQKAAYRDFITDARTILDENKGITSSAAIALVRMLRTQQIVAGHLTDDAGGIHYLPSNRMNALFEVLEETSGKVVIWANFIPTIVSIQDALTKQYGGETVRAIYGDIGDAQRDEALEAFNDPASRVRFMLGNPAVAGFGLNMTTASTAVYYSHDFRLDTRLQSEDRIHRIGQDDPCLYVDLVTPDTIEEDVLNALREKKKLSAQVLGDILRAWI
jgi:SNF2 family DNA or RNA helicase